MISVIVPLYNAGKTLDACIQSILNQNYPKKNYEIIVVDNHSTDNSADIIKKYPVQYVFEKFPSPFKARNTGVKQSKGDIKI